MKNDKYKDSLNETKTVKRIFMCSEIWNTCQLRANVLNSGRENTFPQYNGHFFNVTDHIVIFVSRDETNKRCNVTWII